MSAIYNLEFTHLENEVCIYVNGRLRASNFHQDQPRVNIRYQFYVDKDRHADLTIVCYRGRNSAVHKHQQAQQKTKIAFTINKLGTKRPVTMVHDSWDTTDRPRSSIKEYSYLLKGE